jgi:hypothetical protein
VLSLCEIPKPATIAPTAQHQHRAHREHRQHSRCSLCVCAVFNHSRCCHAVTQSTDSTGNTERARIEHQHRAPATQHAANTPTAPTHRQHRESTDSIAGAQREHRESTDSTEHRLCFWCCHDRALIMHQYSPYMRIIGAMHHIKSPIISALDFARCVMAHIITGRL